ncbi:protein of unknown function [Rhodovastum atsumiense]|nr:protein of unknown function [Rhodovastum atsumiense]
MIEADLHRLNLFLPHIVTELLL